MEFLNQVDSARTPYEKIMTVLRSVQAIYKSYQERAMKSSNGDLAFIAADEFLPVCNFPSGSQSSPLSFFLLCNLSAALVMTIARSVTG